MFSRCGAPILPALIALACGSELPTTPSAVPAATPTQVVPPPPATITVQLSGTVVDGNGAAVPAATVTVRPFIPVRPAPALSTTTAADGTYSFIFENAARQFDVASVQVEKAGYEPVKRVVAPASVVLQTVRIHPITTIALGDARILVTPEDAFCGLEDEWLCRTVWVVAPGDGFLTVDVIAVNPGTRPAVDLNRTFAFPYAATRSIPVNAGARVRVDVFGLYWQATVSEAFTVRTTITRADAST